MFPILPILLAVDTAGRFFIVIVGNLPGSFFKIGQTFLIGDAPKPLKAFDENEVTVDDVDCGRCDHFNEDKVIDDAVLRLSIGPRPILLDLMFRYGESDS